MSTDESTTNVHAFNINDTTIARRFDQSSIADDEVDPELALRQTQFFRFTTNNFLNGIYNIVVESWAEAVNETTIPLLIQQLNLSMRQIGNTEKMEELRKMLLNRLFQHGKLELIFKKAHKFADKFIFYIPPGLEPEQTMSAKEIVEDEDKMWKEIAELEEEVLMLRIQLKFVRDENAKAALCQEFLTALEFELDDQNGDDENDQGNDGEEDEEEEEEMMMTDENDDDL